MEEAVAGLLRDKTRPSCSPEIAMRELALIRPYSFSNSCSEVAVTSKSVIWATLIRLGRLKSVRCMTSISDRMLLSTVRPSSSGRRTVAVST